MKLATDMVLQLVFVTTLFYMLVLQITYETLRNNRESTEFNESTGYRGPTTDKFVIGKQITTRTGYTKLNNYWFEKDQLRNTERSPGQTNAMRIVKEIVKDRFNRETVPKNCQHDPEPGIPSASTPEMALGAALLLLRLHVC